MARKKEDYATVMRAVQARRAKLATRIAKLADEAERIRALAREGQTLEQAEHGFFNGAWPTYQSDYITRQLDNAVSEAKRLP